MKDSLINNIVNISIFHLFEDYFDGNKENNMPLLRSSLFMVRVYYKHIAPPGQVLPHHIILFPGNPFIYGTR
ncbi:MAG: hypothetical protein O9353_12400, partial [Bacteroidia bacterium]|nr:hypothetical protein [Bacteroidia bacterium]